MYLLCTCTFLNTISKHLTFHISKPTNTTVWFWKCFKCYKYHFFVVFFGKRYTKSFIECQVTKALPQFTTPMFDCLTMDIYFQTIFLCLGKLKWTSKKKKKSFQEVELYVPEANTPVYLFHLCLTSAIKPPSRCLGLLYLAFLYRAACDSSLFQTETEYRM